MGENAWCQFCADTQPERYERCDAPCVDLVNWLHVQSKDNIERMLALCLQNLETPPDGEEN